MTSAFEPPTLASRLVRPQSPLSRLVTLPTTTPTCESETEDEEVKLSCIGGILRDEDSDDMNTTAYEDDSEEDEDDEEDVRRVGVVNFISRLLRTSPRIIKPSASRHPTLSPPLELEEEDDEEEDEVAGSEVGARGVALALDSEEEEDDQEDDDDDETSSDSESEIEDESVSGSDADESDMEDEEEDDVDQEELITLDRPPFEQGFIQEDETASVILQVLDEDDDDEEISSLIDSVQGHIPEPLLMNKEESSLHLIGVAQDREDHMASVPRVKRVLSLEETLLAQRDALLPAPQVVLKKRRMSDSDEDGLLSFSLGPPAMTLPETTTVPSRFLSPIISSSEEMEDEDDIEEELDGLAQYELESGSTASSGGDQSPVPLLTPPESPVMGADTCEWPSNLVVDSALTAVLTTQIRPLDTWSEVEEDLKGPSFLTPLMRGIQVCDP